MTEPMSVEGYDVLIEEFKYLLKIEKLKLSHKKLVAISCFF